MESKIRIGNEWKTLLEIPNKMRGYAMVAIGNDRIAFVGGSDTEGNSDVVAVYNLKTKEWSYFRTEEERWFCAAVAIDEKLFVFGGMKALTHGYQSSCEMFDLCDPSHKSHSLPPLSEAKCGLAAVVYDDTNVVVLGGYNGDRVLTNVCMFDTINKNWTALPSMPTSRCDLAVGVAGSLIIAAGGIDIFYNNYRCIQRHCETVEILDMMTRTWKGVAKMNATRNDYGGVVIGDSKDSFHMVVAGGCLEKSCEIYSFKNDGWSSLPVLQSTSRRWRLIVMGGQLIAGGEERLETLAFSTPKLTYELVHFVVELDILSPSSKRKSCKPKRCATVAKKAKGD